jgi:hypothetical protein
MTFPYLSWDDFNWLYEENFYQGLQLVNFFITAIPLFLVATMLGNFLGKLLSPRRDT